MINEQTRNYVLVHENDDVRQLALQGTKDASVDLPMALQQIAGRQTARRKLPTWATVAGIVYPPHLNMEQCSSEMTARYKASITPKVSPTGEGKRFVDLTGGMGVDFYWMSQGFSERVYVEQNAELCAVAEHNFRELDLHCSVCCADNATYLQTMPHAATIYLDPARRNEHGGRTYGMEDCTPNVLQMLPALLEKADTVVLKLSPMLDWRKAADDLRQAAPSGQYISIDMHIVSVDNECKELVIVISHESSASNLRVTCANLKSNGQQDLFTFTYPTPSVYSTPLQGGFLGEDAPSFLYEPNASIMKAGCFAEVERRWGVSQLSANSHLFVSHEEIADFQGRGFQVIALSSMNKRELRAKLSTVESANISVRNFPMTADMLRRKLKLKDGGNTYIFATTTANQQHKLLICRKIG